MGCRDGPGWTAMQPAGPSRFWSVGRFTFACRLLPVHGLVVFHGGLDDALPGRSLGAEGGDEGAVLAAQHEDVRVRLVKVIARGKLRLFHPYPFRKPDRPCKRKGSVSSPAACIPWRFTSPDGVPGFHPT